MPTTNPYSGDTQVADLSKGTSQTAQNPYVTSQPVPQTPAAAQSSTPASFGGSGSALATNNDWGAGSVAQPRMQVSAPAPAPAPQTLHQPTALAPSSWTPPPTGYIAPPAAYPGVGPPPTTLYTSPTPPPGQQPPGMTWVSDGQGHYGWGYVPGQPGYQAPGQQPVFHPTGPVPVNPYPWTGGPPPSAPPGSPTNPIRWLPPNPQQAPQTPLNPIALSPPPMSPGPMPTPHQVLPNQTSAQPVMQTPLPQQDFWATAGGAPPQMGPINWGTPAPTDFWTQAGQSTNPSTYQGPPPPTPPPVQATAQATATTAMSTGVAPWAAALNGGYAMPQFVNPGGGTIPSQQQWAGMTPAEQTAVASLNWSTNGMTSADLSNYLQRSAPQWNTPMPANYRSY